MILMILTELLDPEYRFCSSVFSTVYELPMILFECTLLQSIKFATRMLSSVLQEDKRV